MIKMQSELKETSDKYACSNWGREVFIEKINEGIQRDRELMKDIH
jgi:hypothetical protein